MDMSVQCNMAERRVSAGRNIPSLFLSLFFDFKKTPTLDLHVR